MKHRIRSELLLAMCILLAFGLSPALAQLAPKITVATTWIPAPILTTIDSNGAPFPHWDSGDDYKYVDVKITGTTTVEFWAMELNCAVNANVLETYVWDQNGSSTGDSGDNREPFIWGTDWGASDSWVAHSPPPTISSGLLKYAVAISKRGRTLPIGRNGVETNFEVAWIRFRVKTTSGTSPLTCTFSFLDRNGKVVVPATVISPTSLNILTGYTITGTISYQGRAVKSGIGVDCWYFSAPMPGSPTVTNASGAFTFSGLRDGFPAVSCTIFGNITNPSPGREADVYLAANFGYNEFERDTYRYLPIELKAGNVNTADCDPGPNTVQCINVDDLGTLTGAWNISAAGDANGDGKSDKADLAIIAGNFDRQEVVDASHVLYSLARGWASTGRESRIWRGERDSGEIIQQVPGAANTADFWAALSPDGSTIVFTRKTVVANQPTRYELYTVSTAGGAPQLLIAKAAAGNQDAFAPSWSIDGTRIAFVCSPGYGTAGEPNSGYAYNAGNLCLVDATGRNFQQLNGNSPFGVNTVKIWPPAWDENQGLIFAGTSNAGAGCRESLCYYDFNGSPGTYNVLLDADIPGPASGTGYADMPIMVRMPVMSEPALFYRFTDNSGNQTLRIVIGLDHTCTGTPCNPDRIKVWSDHAARACPSPSNPRPPFAHTTVVFDSNLGAACNYVPLDTRTDVAAPYVVDYYTRLTSWNLMLSADSGTTWNNATQIWGFNCADGTTGANDSDQCWPEWQPSGQIGSEWRGDSHYIGSQVADDWWDGNQATPTLLHAERATAYWTP
jgi:hypothetical protein